ncbi:MAG: hypothetical protein R3A45_05295 [Bdellovibrionota bacterium]
MVKPDMKLSLSLPDSTVLFLNGVLKMNFRNDSKTISLTIPSFMCFQEMSIFQGYEPLGYDRNANRFYDDVQNKITPLGIKNPLNTLQRMENAFLDLIYVQENEWFIAEHIHTEDHSAFAGGRPRLELPENAPSRAFLKAEEALLQMNIKTSPGERALEIGCTPGGTLFALLSRGLDVTGLDPHLPDPKLSKLFPKTFHF